MNTNISVPSSKLENIVSSLKEVDETTSSDRFETKTISVRLPISILSKIDALATMKKTSRNIILNEIIEAAVEDLLTSLRKNKPELADRLIARAEQLAQDIFLEPGFESSHPRRSQRVRHRAHQSNYQKEPASQEESENDHMLYSEQNRDQQKQERDVGKEEDLIRF